MTRSGLGKGAIEQDFFSWLLDRPNIASTLLSRLFRNEYNREDLKKRAEKINAFKPDITIIIHYNAHLSESEKKARLFFTQSNYNLAFVPGAFGKGELKESQDRYEFLRLLVTNDIEDSVLLSEYVLAEFVNQLQVPLVVNTEKNSYLSSVCLFQKDGIYSRNLALTRQVHGPVCYGETLIQNNQEEAYRLASSDSSIQGIPCSKRVEQVALAYFEGIKHYFRP
jgi:N-acetylmuramoyl-L-alanine amidase